MNKKELNQLLNSLTIEEKVGQILQVSGSFFGDESAITAAIKNVGISMENVKRAGSVLNVFTKQKLREVQKKHLESNRIPLIFMADIIYGYKTIFPISLGIACSFNPELVKQTARISATEAAADGLNVTFSPMVDLTRDARWGRVAEGYGEDVYLTSQMAKAMVEGYQGDDLSAKDTICACTKHFAAYGAPVAGRDYNAADMSERVLLEEYLPAYKAAVDAGTALIMTSFNTINGVPATIDRRLMNDILRGEWDYNGTVISDYYAIDQLIDHNAADNPEEVCKAAIDSTVDIDMMGKFMVSSLQKLIESGKVTQQQLDDTVMRILELKNKVGILDDPYRYLGDDGVQPDFEANSKTAYEAVVQSSVLLKNDDGFLPLDADKQSVAFIGPYCDNNCNSALWSAFLPCRDKGISVKQAVENKFGKGKFTFEHGCTTMNKNEYIDAVDEDEDMFENREKYISRAVKAAASADAVVMCMGEHIYQFGESRSRASIGISESQMELLRAVYAVNQNIAVVLFNGRPLDIREISEKSKAVLDVWMPGSMGSQAIADMIFGDAVPSGKLSMSFPYAVGQCPIYYSYLPTSRAPQKDSRYCAYSSRYYDIPAHPLYPFGHGLSYTSFEYSELSASSNTIEEQGKIEISVNVKNTGNVDAYETVQLYVRCVSGHGVSHPVKVMRDMRKPFIKAGCKQKVTFTLTCDSLKFYDAQMEYKAEKGKYIIYVGKSSDQTESVEIMHI